MKNKTTVAWFALLLLLAGAGGSGCSKSFVDKTPATSLPAAGALTNADAMQSALNGAYAALRSVGVYGRDLPVLGDLQGDNTFVEARNSGRYVAEYCYTVIPGDPVVEEIWASAYTGILRANLVIDAKVQGKDADGIRAQAYGIRAILYFKLVNLFATPFVIDSSKWGVPLVLHADTLGLAGAGSGSGAGPGSSAGAGAGAARVSIGKVYEQIVSDLRAAMQDGPEYTSSIVLSRYAAEALLARVYLYEGDNTDALALAEDLIGNGVFRMMTPGQYQAYWADPAPRTDGLETIFEVDCDGLDNNGADDLGGIYINGYQDIYCSVQLYLLYSPWDVRGSVLLPGQTKGGAPAILVNKFPNAQHGDRDNLKVIRLSEVYLIAAEAAMGSDQGMASNLLNFLVSMRDPFFQGYTDQGDQLLADIVMERRKELAFEGDRLYDLNRLGWPVVRMDNAGAVQGGGGSGSNMLLIPAGDHRRILPIPEREILANPSLAGQQNPGY